MKGRVIHSLKELEDFFNKSNPSSYKNARPKFDYDCLIEKFTKCLNQYSTYLNMQNIEISRNHQLEIPFKQKVNLVLGILTKNHQARALYQKLTGDSSSATNMTEKQVMLHVKQLLINRDDKIIADLCNYNKDRPEKYTEF
ncbi:13814_t:CDS:2 [Funneliformis geosporum]|uniref:6041_t:CDS:1 n=1 Tax=Funneliformis geosporum TaxID=1117311 RepID=A0A9W4T5R6_9GLOM|nr:6041_t:CDS:2 [Funneliformis geosporum]CAI2193876.1 13814_t:CDS:2 [Funneliformis geosporum]